MIPIKLKKTSLATIETIISMSPADPGAEDERDGNIEKAVEERVTAYLLSFNSNKVELSEFLFSLNKQEITEILALYYFFSKLTYDTAIVSDEELHTFWELCCTNAEQDIARIGFENMIEYLQERRNLSTILATATINLE